jgi:hypothetical protein
MATKGNKTSRSNVVKMSHSQTPEDQCVHKLKGLVVQAVKVRQAMDFCATYVSDARFLAECEKHPELITTFVLEYHKRHQCSVMDAREYVSRALAERKEASVSSTPHHPADPATT